MNAVMTYEDLIFMRKNKSYGAYVLRKEYKRNMSIALLITIVAFTLSISSPLYLGSGQTSDDPFTHNTVVTILPDPGSVVKDLVEQIVTPVKPLKSTIAFKVPKPTLDEKVTDENIPTIDEMKDKVISTETIEGSKDGIEIISEDPVTTIVNVPKDVVPFTWAEEMPVYSKGDEGLVEFFSRNVRYPEIAKRAGIEGRVYLNFVVERDGSISNVAVLKGIGGGCDEEAVRVLKMGGSWIPGRQNGNTVRVKIVFPIMFRLN